MLKLDIQFKKDCPNALLKEIIEKRFLESVRRFGKDEELYFFLPYIHKEALTEVFLVEGFEKLVLEFSDDEDSHVIWDIEITPPDSLEVF